MNLLALSAKRKSGKTEAAKYLLSRFPDLFDKKVAFGDAVKSKSFHVLGYGESALNSPESKEHWRKFIVKWCDEQRRMDPFVFCRPVFEVIESHTGKGILCDDLRDPEREAKPLEEKGFHLLRIECPMWKRIENGFLENVTADNHWTETAMDSWLWTPEQIVVNDCPLEEFQKRLDSVVYKLFGGEK